MMARNLFKEKKEAREQKEQEEAMKNQMEKEPLEFPEAPQNVQQQAQQVLVPIEQFLIQRIEEIRIHNDLQFAMLYNKMIEGFKLAGVEFPELQEKKADDKM